MEEWKRIYINGEVTNYEISNFGRCRNITRLHWKTKGVLAVKQNRKTKYCQYGITLNGKSYYKYIHRLVAEAFIQGDNHLEVNHKDGNKSNNEVNNLEWVTKHQNMRHCFDNGLSSVAKPVKQYDLKGNYVADYISASEASRQLGITQGNISAALLGNYNYACGFQWRYANNTTPVRDISNEVTLLNIPVVQLSMDGEYIKTFDKVTLAYKEINKRDNGIISQVCKGNRNSFAGFKWMYLSDYINNVDEEIVYSHS